MAGTRPARRSRLATPLPIPTRLSMVSARISMTSASFLRSVRLDEKPGHGVLVVDATYRLGHQRGHREYPDLREVLVGGEGDGIGDDDLFEHRLIDALDGGAGQHAVDGGGEDAPRALAPERVHRLDQGSRGVDHVVDDHDVLALDVADEVHEHGHVGAVAALVDDGP